VTVTGPGGVGKTRLALQAAADQLPSLSDGAWLCELAPAADQETMAQAVAAALRARPRPGLSVADSVVEFLRTRTALLLVLDNCEHLAAAAASLAADILRGCPRVRILATSQQPLGVGGEQVFGLRPLSLPPPDAGMAAAGASDAVSLFAQRAAARRDFALTPSNVAAVGEICRRLDGIPLAIELAAARVAAVRPAEIAALLDERFRLLTRGRADASARQQTLQATLEWSYALLGHAERRVFDGLGVFPGSFDAEAAVAVAGADGLQRWDVLDGLTSLVGKSLVAEEEGPGQTSRYRLLETMRAYARQQLAAGELGRLQLRHAEHYAAFAEQAGLEVAGPAQLEWQPRIQRGASIARQARQEATEQGIEILVAEFLATEATAWTAAGDYAAARLPAMEAVEVARRVQNPAASAFAFLTAAGAIWPSDPQAALMLIEDSLALTRAGASDPVLDTALMLAGLIRARTGNLPRALAALQEAMAQQHADGDRLLLGITLQIAAVGLAGLGEAEPAAVLAGAFSAHFPPDISAVPKDEQMWIGEAQSLARRALGEAAYRAALARGAAMDDDQIVGYAQGQYRRLVAPRAEPGAQASESPPGPGAADPPGMTVLPRQDNVPQ